MASRSSGWLMRMCATRHTALSGTETAVHAANMAVKESGEGSRYHEEGNAGKKRCGKGCTGKCACCTPSSAAGAERERSSLSSSFSMMSGRDMLQLSGAREDTTARQGLALGSEDFEMCAVPKRRVSHSRKGLRSGGKRLELSRAAPKVLIRCEVCGGLRLPHHVCRACVKALTKNTVTPINEDVAAA